LLLDKQIPICVRTSRRRPSNAWFDDDCRQDKRLVRSKKRTYRRMVPGSTQVPSTLIEWRHERRHYINFVQGKRSSFWTNRIKADQKQPRRLWKSFDEILGWGCEPPSIIDPTTFLHFFSDEVSSVRASTAKCPYTRLHTSSE